MYSSPNPVFRSVKALLWAGALLLNNCRSDSDKTRDTHVPAVPSTMMGPLDVMAEHSQALPLTTNLDLYFALLMRENHQAAVAMSALELKDGQDPVLRRVAQDIHRAHQQLIPGLDSAIQRLRTLPPSFPEHTTQSEELARLLETATTGLHPAAHRTIVQAEGGDGSPNLGMRESREDAGTGSIDRDYAVLLVPHHQNSMALAQAELELGRDASLQKAAYLILQDQQREIDQAQAWLSKHPAPVK
jgi:uncharacterized protein (DUF305 family)